MILDNCVVSMVVAGGPASKENEEGEVIQASDIVTAIDGTAVTTKERE